MGGVIAKIILFLEQVSQLANLGLQQRCLNHWEFMVVSSLSMNMKLLVSISRRQLNVRILHEAG
jgi:hypothetical protein